MTTKKLKISPKRKPTIYIDDIDFEDIDWDKIEIKPPTKTSPTKTSNKIKNIGKLKDTYLIGISIGEGGYGTVRKAKNKKTKMLGAIKLVPTDNMYLSEVERELAVISRLSLYPRCNKYIICYNDIFMADYHDRKYYIFSMEYFEGKELFDLIEMKNATSYNIPKASIRAIFSDLMEGISYIHKNNISHRDIKSNNVMFNSTGLKIVDFGFACFMDKCDLLLGTPMYFPPEKYKYIGKKGGIPKFDEEKADVWAAGLILLEMLTYYDIEKNIDHIINGTGGPEEGIIKVMSKRRWEKAPADFKEILLSSLETDPKKRASSDDVLEILKKSKNKYNTYQKVWEFWLKCKYEEETLF